MKVSRCPACGAPLPPGSRQCAYCQSYLIVDAPPGASSPGGAGAAFAGFLFERQAEPNEQAFTLSLPQGWMMEGGIQRANMLQQQVDAQAIEAKLDLTVKRDDVGSVAIRWCPSIKFCDVRMSPAAMMFPQGSTYSGMIVWPLMPAQDFLVQNVFPWAHPDVRDVRVEEGQQEPALVQNYRSNMARMGIQTPFSYDGATVTFAYAEHGVNFREAGFTVIENMGPVAAGMWSNKDTLLFRTPADEFETWEPVLHHILASVEINPRWLAAEIASQEMLSRSFLNAQQAQQARERRMLEIQQQMQQIDREIADHRSRTNAEIQNDTYLTLMEQEEFYNPHTERIETGSNQWNYRWVSSDGAEFYTDREDDDPNIPNLLNHSDWTRTPVRKRFLQ